MDKNNNNLIRITSTLANILLEPEILGSRNVNFN